MAKKKLGRLADVLLALPRIGGAGATAAYSLATGDPVGGAMVGEALAVTGEDILQRALSARQEDRVATVIERAQLEVERRLNAGLVLRSDGIFNGPTPEAEEIIEGTLLAARDEHQQKKLPYMANLIANFAFASDVTPEAANLALNDAESLSWLDLCVMAMVDRREEFPNLDRTIEETDGSLAFWVVWVSLRELGTRGFVISKSFDGPEMRPTRVLTQRGELVSRLMDLDAIPRSEVAGPYNLLIAGADYRAAENAKLSAAQVANSDK